MAAKSKSKLEKVNIGVIGVGGIGRVHLGGYEKCPEAKVVAVCDLIEDRTQWAADKYGIDKTFKDYKEMLQLPEIDAVSICVPNYLHAEMAIAAFEAGKHVLCEKPLCINPKDGEAMVAASQKANKKFMTAFNNRFRGDTQTLKKFIEGGELGEIYFGKTGWIRRKGIPGMGSWFTQKAKAGGGPLIDIGVHVLDLALWLMGNPKAVSVTGSTYSVFGCKGEGMGDWGTSEAGGICDVEDLAAGFIKLDTGATLMLEASWASHIEKDLIFTSLIGTKGGADVDPFRIYKDMHGSIVDITPGFRNQSGHDMEIRHFIDCLIQNKTPISTGEHGLEVVRILNAIYKSAATGKEVRLK